MSDRRPAIGLACHVEDDDGSWAPPLSGQLSVPCGLLARRRKVGLAGVRELFVAFAGIAPLGEAHADVVFPLPLPWPIRL